MKIKLVRHAFSMLNAKMIKHQDMPNHLIPIVSDIGKKQAIDAGKLIGKEFIKEAILYQSPYLRTRQTMNFLLEGAGFLENEKTPKVYEDPRLREVDFGYGDPEEQKPIREKEGYFWYRMNGGESAADCYDRVSTFLDSMMRQVERKPGWNGSKRNVLIVTHGLIIRCFVMRFLHSLGYSRTL
jgi:broad specificity phosphatase PhoE